jgi:hypothetical protein
MKIRVPIVWQLLEDMCIPEHEHDVWLEYIIVYLQFTIIDKCIYKEVKKYKLEREKIN